MSDVLVPPSLTLKTEAAISAEMLAPLYQTTQQSKPQRIIFSIVTSARTSDLKKQNFKASKQDTS
jgi:hypothetical protein